MFGSRLTKESLTEDVSSASNVKTRRDANKILENLFNYDPDDEEDSALMQVFQELASVGGIDDIMTLSSKDLRTLHSHLDKKSNGILPMRNITRIKHLQRFLKNLQQRGNCEMGIDFDYYSIDEDDYLSFTCHTYNF